MTRSAFLHILWLFGVFQLIGLKVSIHTERTVMARLGEEVQLSCQLLTPSDVFQVSWYKVLPDGEKMVAADNKYFGQRVEREFSSRVEFKDASLQDSSIVIREVTEEDEGCYQCLFNTYPDGVLNETTCLKPYELHGPFLHVRESNFPKEVYISCSATGQPGLIVTIRALHHKVHKLSTHSQDNKNDTVTVSSTVVLPHSYDINIEVECAIEMLFGATTKAFVTIHKIERPSAAKSFDKKYVAQNDVYRQTLINVLFVIAACVLAATLIWSCLQYENQSR
ncbi:OX-2 membrane glycoprotein-like [Cheilinus undulatus]|uniref:OX-2 membrane glycoprotein-like n=1 Tax=Cheilinus undulatus TaxID=241271 RepID=UPI001BD4CE6B|nr:OX-2 membrane glycoprotein-like [Cheilinus undulatus]